MRITFQEDNVQIDGDRVFFTSDTHFGHRNILIYCRDSRCFEDIESHDELLIQRWNTIVSDCDIIVHLGDVALTSILKVSSILSQLNGIKVLIPGNHDFRYLKKMEEFRQHWTHITSSKKIQCVKVEPDSCMLALSHFPHSLWPNMEIGRIHLHGHCHSSRQSGLRPNFQMNRLDVGVDFHNAFPISLSIIRQELLYAAYTEYF